MSHDPADREGARPRTLWIEGLVGLALTAGVLALHVERYLHAGGLWRDEAGAARLASLPSFRDIFALFPHEAFPMLFPELVHAYGSQFGFGDTALRAFGFAVGLLVVAILWLNAAVTARTVPLLSLALLGFDAQFVGFGDSVRGYGLGCVFLLLTYGALAALLRRSPRSPGRQRLLGLGLALAAVASVQVLQGNAPLLAALCVSGSVVAVLQGRRGLAAWSLCCGALAALSLLPYAASLAAARREWSLIVVGDRNLANIGYRFISTLGPRAVAFLWLVLLVAAFTYLVKAFRRRAPGANRRAIPALRDAAEAEADGVCWFAALTLGTGGFATLVFLVVLGYPPRPWYFLTLMAVLATALDSLFGELLRTPGTGALARLRTVAVALVVLMDVALSPSALAARQTNVDLAAHAVAAAARSGDLVVVNPWYYGVSFARYYAGPARWMTVPNLPDHRVHRYDLVKVKLAAADPIGDVEQAAEATFRAGHRVFLIGHLEDPAPGAEPMVIAPAPRSQFGWNGTPYEHAWSQQLTSFLLFRASAVSPLAIAGGGPVSDLEDMEAWSFTGRKARRPRAGAFAPNQRNRRAMSVSLRTDPRCEVKAGNRRAEDRPPI